MIGLMFFDATGSSRQYFHFRVSGSDNQAISQAASSVFPI